MSNTADRDQNDFEVLPSPRDGVADFSQAFNSLRRSLKPADAKLLTRPDEAFEDFIVRVALGATSTTAALFRKNDSAADIKIQAWLALAGEKAKEFIIGNDIAKFKGLSTTQLRELGKISVDPNSVHTITETLSRNFGIVLIVLPAFTSMKMDGCTFRLNNGYPVVGISLRYNRYDNFWFTLMHELAHICLHYEQLDAPIVDDLDITNDSEIEIEANIIAKDSLIPRQYWRLIWNAKDNSTTWLSLCKQAEVHPEIAAGMIRYQTKNYKLFPEHHHTMDMRKAFGIKDD